MMSLFKGFLCASVLSVLALPSFADTVEGEIGQFRTFPAGHYNAAVVNHVIFNIADQALNNGCSWLYVAPEDTTSVSLLLASKFASQPVVVAYGTGKSPWHSGTCQATEVTVK